MDKLVDTFSNRLKKAMNIRNIRASELSLKTGIAKSSLSEYINGKYEAKQDGLYTLAQALSVSEAWLMGLDVPMEREIPYSAIYDFATDNEKQILNTSISFAIQNRISKEDIPNNNEVKALLNKLDTLNYNTAIQFIQYFSNMYKGMDNFDLEEAITSLIYNRANKDEPKIKDIYMHLAKEAQELELEQEDIDYILNFYKRNKK